MLGEGRAGGHSRPEMQKQLPGGRNIFAKKLARQDGEWGRPWAAGCQVHYLTLL